MIRTTRLPFFTRTVIAGALALVALPLAACQGGLAESTRADSSEIVVVSETVAAIHIRELAGCTAKFDAVAATSSSDEERRVATVSYVECLASSNNGTLEPIQDKIGNSPLGPEVRSVWLAYINAEPGVCRALADASPTADATTRRLELSTCIAKTNLALADLIERHTALGQTTRPDRDLESAFPECKAALDSAVGDRASTRELVVALSDFITCARADIDRDVPALAAAIVATFPDRPLEESEANVRTAFAVGDEATDRMCEVLAAAGEMAGGSHERVIALACVADALGHLHDILPANLR